VSGAAGVAPDLHRRSLRRAALRGAAPPHRPTGSTLDRIEYLANGERNAREEKRGFFIFGPGRRGP
jgi:hypothetical protein